VSRFKVERRWTTHDYSPAREHAETVEIVAFVVLPGGIPTHDKYGLTGEHTSPATRAVVIGDDGHYEVVAVESLWRVEA
jgi:hypothetical protein